MANPAKVLNFFDIAGTWYLSLAFVMGGGLVVAFTGYRLVFGRQSRPVFEAGFDLPKQRRIDVELVGGAAVFGIGGHRRLLPGRRDTGAWPRLLRGPVFLAAMIAGIVVGRALRSRLAASVPARHRAVPVAADAP